MAAPTLVIAAVAFLASLVGSTVGFGEALIAVPLLALVIPVKVAAPLVVLLSVTIAAIVVAQDWRKIHLRSVAWLLAPAAVGIPLGVALLASPDRLLVKAALGVVILAFSGYSLLGRSPPELRRDSRPWMLVCGFVAGVLGGAYGMDGPPLVIYGAMRRWSPQHFRATLRGFFLPASAAALAGYWLAGLWVPEVTRDYLFCLPFVVPAILAGRVANRRLHGESFARYVHAGLLCIGLVLLVQAIRRQ
jgi:uncharacterized protein